MNLKGKKVRLHDMTLRDGMHPKRHLMTLEQMKLLMRHYEKAMGSYTYLTVEE